MFLVELLVFKSEMEIIQKLLQQLEGKEILELKQNHLKLLLDLIGKILK